MIIEGDAFTQLGQLHTDSIDLTVTSPPYDALREYGAHTWDFEGIASELYRVTKHNGIVVWVVGDQTENGNESLTSFRQALYFQDKVGFKTHDTMFYIKDCNTYPTNPAQRRYHQVVEYMFIMCKGDHPKTWNPIKDRKNIRGGGYYTTHVRKADGEVKYTPDKMLIEDMGLRWNYWIYGTGYMKHSTDPLAFEHPAIFPEKLAEDHIKTWTNEGDIVLDPFAGSGTTLIAAWKLNRQFIGIEINSEYVKLMHRRMDKYLKQSRLV